MARGGGGALGLAVAAWLAGTALQLQAERLCPPLGLLATLGLALLAGTGVARARRASRGRALAALAWGVLWAALALAWAGWRAADRMALRLPAALEGVPIVVEGRVVGLPQADPMGQRFELHPARAWRRGAHGPVPVDLPALLLRWPAGGAGEDLAAVAGPAPRAGELWRLPVRLHAPHGSLNPGGFDAELWLFEQGLGGVGAVRRDEAGGARRLARPRAWHPRDRIDAWRQEGRDRLLQGHPDPAVAGLLAALAVGDQGAIPPEQWELYRRTGVAHLVAISGSHITVFAALAAGVLQLLWRRWPAACLRCPAPVAGRWGGWALATAYAVLAGWGVPAQRTVLMLGLAVAGRSLGPGWPGWALCATAAAGVTLWDPWALLQPGFWLSFAAVALLMGLPAPRVAADQPSALHGALRGLASAWRLQWRVSVGLAPLTLLLFGQLSLVGLPANLVAVPWVGGLVTPLALAGLVCPPLWTLAGWVLPPLQAWLQWLSGLPLAVWSAPPAGAAALGLSLLGAGLLVARLPWHWRLWGVPLLLPTVMARVPGPGEGQFELLVADVGQGSAVLVRTARHTLLHDAGPRYGPDSDAGQRVLLPLLQTLGVRALDELVLSHRDLDHVGGAAALATLPVRHLRASLEPGHPLWALVRPASPCRAGQHWRWDGVEFEVLHPPVPPAGPGASNAQSCVLRVRAVDGTQALLTGDLPAAQEQALAADPGWAPRLRSQVLVVPHHGSATSSSDAFLDAVQPRVAVAQLGYRNRFGHPDPQVVARFQRRGIELVRTDQCGAWWWRESGATCTRDVRRRYWHSPTPHSSPGAGAVVASTRSAGECP